VTLAIMMMTISFINTNLNAIKALNTLSTNAKRRDKASQQLASGYKVETSADDPSGYAISQRLSNAILTSNRSQQNIQDGTSLLDVTDGTLGVITDSLQRVRELTIQLASDVNNTNQRAILGQEIRSLLEDIDRQSAASEFNGVKLLNGTATNARIQLGGESNLVSNTIDVTPALANSSSTALGLVATPKTGRWFATSLNDIFNAGTTQLDSSDKALSFLQDVDAALTQVGSQRSRVGAYLNQLNRAFDFLGQYSQNLEASRSRIRDTDVAKASADYTQNNVLTQASTSILTQANSQYEQVLQLLQR
jgi:flagellin